MNKNTLLITLALTSGLLAAGCNKAGKLSQPSTEKAPPTGPVTLALKWTEGETIVKRLDLKMESEINVPNQPTPIKQSSTLGQKYGVTVAKAQPDGGHEVDMEFLGMNMKVEQAGQTVVNYDSENKAADASKDKASAMFGEIFSKIIGTKLQYFLNATNGVDHVEGLDALRSKLAGGQPGVSDSLKSMFNDAYLREMVGDTRALPSQPVQPGDSWPFQTEMSLGEMGLLSISNNYTFVQWEKHGPRLCARLDFDGTMKGKPAPNANPKTMSLNIQDGSNSGTAWFDPELGTFIDSTATQDLSIAMEVPIKGKDGKTVRQSLSMKMHQILGIKLDSLK
jgi:hypothetical protein